jgi:thiol-disulfide isomerase/thioredoxin
MSVFRNVFLFLILATFGVLTFASEDLTLYAIHDLKFGWLFGLLLPKFLVVLSTLTLLTICWPSLKNIGNLKWLVSLIIIGLSSGLYLFFNVPYKADWAKKGTNLVNGGANPVEVFLQETQPEFEGLVCFSLPGCDHCKAAISKLELLGQRNPNLDLLVFVFSEDSTVVNSYKNQSVGSSLTYLAVPNPNESIRLNSGAFPCFFYFKNEKLIYRWFSTEFGYPAFDWVENRLQ